MVICERRAAGFAHTELWRIFPKLVGVTEAGVLTYVVILRKRRAREQLRGHGIRKTRRKSSESTEEKVLICAALHAHRCARTWRTPPGATPYLGPDTGPTADAPGGTNVTGTRRVRGHPPPEDKTPYGPLPQTIQQLR